MKKTKIVLIVLGGIVVLAVVVVFFLFQNLDGIVKAAIEKYGTEAAGTPVKVRTVKLALTKGRGTIGGLTVDNPLGFSSHPLFRLGEITVAVDTSTLTSDLPVIQQIHVGSPTFRYEVNAKGETNLGLVRKNIQRFSAAHVGGKKTTPGSSGAGGTHLLVRRLKIEGGEGTLDLRAVGGKELKANLPPITLTDLGGRQGITPAVLGRTVLAALVDDLDKTAVQRGVTQALQGRLGNEAGKLEKKLDQNLGPNAGGALKKMLGQ